MNYDLTILYQLTDSLTGIVGVGGASTESPSSGTSTTSLEGLKYQRDLSSCLGFHKSGGNVSAITSSSCKNGGTVNIHTWEAPGHLLLSWYPSDVDSTVGTSKC